MRAQVAVRRGRQGSDEKVLAHDKGHGRCCAEQGTHAEEGSHDWREGYLCGGGKED